MNPDAGRAGLPVLTYHSINPRRSVTATDPSRFAETLAALLEAGYCGVDLGDWVEHGRPDEPRGFALAFDDGLQSLLRVADLVTRYRVPATVFLVTGRVGGDNAWPGQRPDVSVEPLLSWSEIADLARRGFRFASHGQTHRPFDRLRGDALTREIRGSRDTIEDRLGHPCRLLAYPNGSSSPQIRLEAARHVSAAFGTRLDYADGGRDPFDLSRIDAYYLRPRRPLESLIAGRARGWLRRRRVLRAVRRGAGSILRVGGVAC